MTTTEFIQMFMGGAIVSPIQTATDTLYMYAAGGYSTARDATTADGMGSQLYQSTVAAKTASNGYSIVTRTFALFNFANLTQTVTAAKLKIYAGTTVPTYNTDIVVQKCDNTGTLVLGDFDNMTTYYGRNSTKLNDADGYYFIIDLNATAITDINAKGLLRFVARNGAYDYDNVTPTDVASNPGVSIEAATIELTY